MKKISLFLTKIIFCLGLFSVLFLSLKSNVNALERKETTTVEKGVLDTRTPYLDCTGGDPFGTTLCDDGSYIINSYNWGAYSWDAGILSCESIDFLTFDMTLDLSNVIVNGAHHAPHLVFASAKNSFAWDNQLLIRFEKDNSGTDSYVIHMAQNYGLNFYKAGAAILDTPIIHFVIEDDETNNVINFKFNDTVVSCPRTDFIGADKKFFNANNDINNMYFGFSGTPEDDTVSSLKVSEVNDSKRKAYDALVKEDVDKLNSFITCCSDLSSSENLESAKSLYNDVNSIDFSNFRSYEKAKYTSLLNEAMANYRSTPLKGHFDAKSPYKVAAGDANIYGTQKNEDGSNTLYLGEWSAWDWSIGLINDVDPIDLASFELSFNLGLCQGYGNHTNPTLVIGSDPSFVDNNPLAIRFDRDTANPNQYVIHFCSFNFTSFYKAGAAIINSETGDISLKVSFDNENNNYIFDFNGTKVTCPISDFSGDSRQFFAQDEDFKSMYYGFRGCVSTGSVPQIITVLSQNDNNKKQYEADKNTILTKINNLLTALDNNQSIDDIKEMRKELDLVQESENYLYKNIRRYDENFISSCNEKIALADNKIAAYSQQEEIDTYAQACLTEFSNKVNSVDSLDSASVASEYYEAIDFDKILQATNGSDIKAQIDEIKAQLDKKIEDLSKPSYPTALQMGEYDSRVPYTPVGENSGSFYNEETGMNELLIHNLWGGRFAYNNSIDFNAFETTIDISKIPYSANIATTMFLIFSSTFNGYALTDADLLDTTKDNDIPLLIGFTKNPSGVVTAHFWKNWFVNGCGLDVDFRGSSDTQVCFILGQVTEINLKISIKDDCVVFTFNNVLSESVPTSCFIGESRQVFNSTADLSKLYFGIGANCPEVLSVEVKVSKILDKNEMAYQESIKELVSEITNYAEAAAHITSKEDLAKALLFKKDFDLSIFNETDKAKYQKLITDSQAYIDLAINEYGEVDADYMVNEFIDSATNAETLSDIKAALDIYELLSTEQKESVNEEYINLMLKQNINGWTKKGSMITLKTFSSIKGYGVSYDDMLYSDAKFLMTNFTIDLKFNNVADGWFAICLSSDKNGVNSAVTIDNAEDYKGVYLLVHFMENNNIEVSVHVIKTSTVDFTSSYRGTINATITNNQLKLRLYPDEDNTYLQIDVNGKKLLSNRLRLSEVNGIFGSENKGYLGLQTYAGEDKNAYFEFELCQINNKTVFDTGVLNPDLNNLEKYDSGNDDVNDEPVDNTGCNCSNSNAFVIILSLISFSNLFFLLRKRGR